MAKGELNKVPLFNIFFKKMDIPVDRKSKVGSHKAFLKAAEDIEKGYSVVIFPEATISENVPELIRFKNGAFKLAIDKQVPLVPVTFLNNWKIVPHKKNFKKYGGPGIARVIIHKPIDTKGMTEDNVDDLRRDVFNIINNSLKGKA